MGKVWVALGSLFGVVVLSIVALHLYFGSSSFRALVEQEVEVALNREVTINAIELGLLTSFPQLMVQLQGVEVQEAEQASHLLAIQDVEIAVALWPLLDETLVCAITVRKPQVIVEAYADGSSNLSDLISEEWLNGSEESSFQTVVLTELMIVDADVRYQNATGRTLGILGLESQVQAYLGEDSTSFAGTVQTTAVHLGGWEQGVQRELPSLMNLAFGLGAEQRNVQLAQAQLQVGLYELDLAGLPIDWNTVPHIVDLAVRLHALAEAPEAQVEALREEAQLAAQLLIAQERERLRNKLDDVIQEGADRLKNRLDRLLERDDG